MSVYLLNCTCVYSFTLTDCALAIPSNICGCQSGTVRGPKEKVNGSHHGDNARLKPPGIQNATKPLAGLTNREHRELTGVKTVSLGTNYSFSVQSAASISKRRMSDVLPCPSTTVIKSRFPMKLSEVRRRQVTRDFTRTATDQGQNGSSNLLTPYREQPRSNRIVVAYPRPALSATKLKNHAPISFDLQAQVSLGQT